MELNVLAFQHWQNDYIVDTDTLNEHTACVILLEQHNLIDKQIEYWPCLPNEAKRVYDITSQ